MKKITVISFIIGCSALLLTGCMQQEVSLSEEQHKLVAEYAASLLLKYNSDTRLVDTKAVEEKMALEKQRQDEIQRKFEERQKLKDEKTNNNSSNKSTSEEDNSVRSFNDINQMLSLGQGSITYNGYEFYQSYPEDDLTFALNAMEGKKLIVMSFTISNGSEETNEIDTLSQNLRCKVKVNDAIYAIQPTLLLNDLVALQEIMQPNESMEAVLVAEVPSEIEEISSISLNLRNDEGKGEYLLQ